MGNKKWRMRMHAPWNFLARKIVNKISSRDAQVFGAKWVLESALHLCSMRADAQHD